LSQTSSSHLRKNQKGEVVIGFLVNDALYLRNAATHPCRALF
jgi:hypothetical protein